MKNLFYVHFFQKAKNCVFTFSEWLRIRLEKIHQSSALIFYKWNDNCHHQQLNKIHMEISSRNEAGLNTTIMSYHIFSHLTLIIWLIKVIALSSWQLFCLQNERDDVILAGIRCRRFKLQLRHIQWIFFI